MPTQLQLEGPDLESLLTRVKSELGPTARIVRAEKVRTGGIAGFFAKQRFEISVEVGDEPVTAVPAGPMSLLDLADQVSSTEQLGLSLRHTAESRSPVPGVTAPPTPAPSLSPAETAAAATSLIPQQPKAEDPTFATVLASLQASNETGPAAIPVLAAPAIPVLAAPATAAAPAAEVPVAAAPAAEASAALERSSTHVSTEGTTFAALVAHLEATAGPAGGTTSPARTGPLATVPAVPQFLEPAAVDGTVVTIPAARTPEPVTTPVALPVHLPFGRAQSAPTMRSQLARLGLPAHLQPFGPDEAVYSTLLKSLRALPKAPAPTNRAGTVLAIVGPLPQALEAARALARELKLQPASAVVLATSRRTLTDLPERQVLRDLDQAELRRASWRRRRNTTIVAVDAPMTATGAVQARAYLSALAPSATWGAVEATRKPLDVAAFARAVGGFDALALSAVDETSDPAAVLELGIPVARLGEQPATPSAWAALLAGRLAA